MGPEQELPLRIQTSSTTQGKSAHGENGLKGTPHSPKLQHYWNFTRFFCVISRTFVGGVLPLCRDGVGIFCSPSWLSSLVRGILPLCNDSVGIYCNPSRLVQPRRRSNSNGWVLYTPHPPRTGPWFYDAVSYHSQCNIMAEGFRFIYLAFRFSLAENLLLSTWVQH